MLALQSDAQQAFLAISPFRAECQIPHCEATLYILKIHLAGSEVAAADYISPSTSSLSLKLS